MFPQLRSRRLIWIALIAWLAQLCLPVAHAAVMAQPRAGLATWCGEFSPAMTRKLAALPLEVREILQQGSAQSGAHQDCSQLCANAASGAVPPPAVTVSLRAGGLETAPSAPVVRAHHAYSKSEPARGPPLTS